MQRQNTIAWLSGALAVALGGACGDSEANGDTESGGPGTISLSSSATDSATDGTTDEAEGSGGTETPTDTTGDACPPTQACGDACCDAGERCDENEVCVLDCGADNPCGDVCCDAAGGEICYVGQCIVPSGSCSGAACATQVESECGDGEICDPTLGQCVPNFANPSCAFEPEVGVFDPIPRFTWGVRAERSCDDELGCQVEETCNAATNLCEPTWPHINIAEDDFPAFHQCVMTPQVADLDGDCIPEIIFNTYQNSAYTNNGILRAIRGDTGEKLWTLGDEAYRTDPGSHPAIGDINGDGIPEVISEHTSNSLIAVQGDTGQVLWQSENHNNGGLSGAPSLVNFDNAGNPEIAFGHTIYDNTGAIIFEAAGSEATGTNGVGPISCVADLNGDGRPELIAGATVWTFTGTVGVDFAGTELWQGSPADGYCGIADFNLDGQPEVATVRSNDITIFNGQTGDVIAQTSITGGGAGGPPNIADFDGDGLPDIGTAGGNNYVVVQYDGTAELKELWNAETKDGSSQRTGSSVFDFDGDGRSEVIYADEWFLRIYPGTEPDCPGGPNCDGVMTDDEILFIDINSSRTRSENPIVADVDGDFKAEIIVSTNNESGQGAIGDAGIEVFEDRLDNWVGTLPIWNQHSYHVTNVLQNATIPLTEEPNWSVPVGNPYNSYRRNGQGELEALCAPDLTAADLVLDQFSCTEDLLDLSFKVINEGCLGVGPGVNVALYEDGTLLQVFV
ncbi:MAG: VCBS repeat-containing protein, partial [Myxococcota bacterium]